MTTYRVSASNDSLANRGPQPRTLVLGERSESADVHRGSDESVSQAVAPFSTKLTPPFGKGPVPEKNFHRTCSFSACRPHLTSNQFIIEVTTMKSMWMASVCA